MGMLESLRQRVGGARNDDQMYMIRHQAIAEQREVIEFAVLVEKFQIGKTIGVTVDDYLPGVAALRNMMRNVGHDHTRQTSHGREPIRCGSRFLQYWGSLRR